MVMLPHVDGVELKRKMLAALRDELKWMSKRSMAEFSIIFSSEDDRVCTEVAGLHIMFTVATRGWPRG